MGFENDFNSIYFYHNFYLKTSVSRNGLSPGYSERDISSVVTVLQSSSNFQTVFRQSSGSHQAVIKESSGSHPPLVRQLSRSRQSFPQLSKICLKICYLLRRLWD